jgi:hypothetical protein
MHADRIIVTTARDQTIVEVIVGLICSGLTTVSSCVLQGLTGDPTLKVIHIHTM